MVERCEVINLKRSTGRYFIKIFVMSFFVILILLSVGVLSYKAAMHFWKPKEDSVVAYQNDTISEKGEKVVIEEVAKNLIICYDDTTKDITKIVLEVLNSHSKQLNYLTLPVRTEHTLSISLYKKMIVDCPEAPQVLKLSTLSKYFDLKKAIEYEVLMIEELLKTDIHYYTAIPSSTYDKIFTQRSVKQTDGYDAVSMEVFTKDFNNELKSFTSKDKLANYIEKIYPSLESKLTLEDKLEYIEYYYDALPDHISFELVKGYSRNNAYRIDTEQAAEQLGQLLEE